MGFNPHRTDGWDWTSDEHRRLQCEGSHYEVSHCEGLSGHTVKGHAVRGDTVPCDPSIALRWTK